MKRKQAAAHLIRQLILQGGMTQKEIAEEAGVSVRTVYNIKKDMPVNILSDATGTDDDTIVDPLALYTKKERAYIKKISKDAYLYEDVEEGWTYHYDKHNHAVRTSGLWWAAIAYPESVPEGWIDMLARTGLAIAISPLHDKDKWDHDSPRMVDPETGEIIEKGARYKAGDPKKAHWHILIICNQSESFKQINDLIRPITQGPYLQKVRSLKYMYDYFTHETDEAKRQMKYIYDKREIVTFNGFHVVPNKYEIGVLQCEIIKRIQERHISDIGDLLASMTEQPEMMSIITAKPGIFTAAVRSEYRKAHPESRVQMVLQIDEKQYTEIQKGGKKDGC